MMYSACKLNKQSDNIQPWCTPFPICVCICAFYFSILFHFNLPHETGYSSLGYTVGLGWLSILTAMCLVTQSCLTFSNPMDCSPPGSSVHGISQARLQEWVDFSSSRRFSQPRDRTQVSRIAGRFSTSWATWEAQEYWSGSNTGVGSLSLLQRIFPTQEPNQGRLFTNWAMREAQEYP